MISPIQYIYMYCERIRRPNRAYPVPWVRLEWPVQLGSGQLAEAHVSPTGVAEAHVSPQQCTQLDVGAATIAVGTAMQHTPLFAALIAIFAVTTLALPAVAPPRSFAAGGMLEFTYPIASPSLATLDVKEEREDNKAPTGAVEILHRVVVMRTGGALGPSTIPHPELLAHGPVTTYFQPLDGEMRRRQRRRRAQDAIPENSDALTAPFHGAVCDGKPGLRCTVFEAPIVYGAIGDGAARRTFMYYQNVGSIGPLLDAAQALPEPILSVNTWSRPFGLGWQLPPPAIPLTLRSNLTLSDAWLMVTSETADNAGERADLFLRLLAKLLEKVTPPSRDIADWDDVVQRQSDWTLNTVSTCTCTESPVYTDRVLAQS